MRSALISGLFTAVVTLFFAVSATAVTPDQQQHVDGHHDHEHTEASEGFDITGVIMHHIQDEHGWHLFDWGGHPVSLSLPVILFTESGLTTFMSSEFHHDVDGKVVVEKNGERFTYYHGHIYYANAEANDHGAFITYTEDHKVANAKPLDFSITKNVASLFVTVFLMLLVFLPVAKFYKKNPGKAPKGLAGIFEPLILFVRDDVALPNIGEKHYKRFTPYLLTLFFFIWFANMLGLVPFAPGGANLSGNIAFTMVLAAMTLLLVNLNGNKDYWMHMIWMPGVPWPIRLLLAPIELVGILTKPFALMIRLFANMTAGHIVILSLISLTFVFESFAVAPASMALTLFIYVIKLLVAFLQAYIFALLTALFVGQAVAEHDHH
ncbi:MAG: F0F1 ATP synthase subunit A [Schleiferiaceae bacterium]|nr:F0F1 ATP synthase subunit A [Schleiferiaceae bacterium]